MTRLLFVAASPNGWIPLNFGKEHAVIEAAIDKSCNRSQLHPLAPQLQSSLLDLSHAIAKGRPDVVHISGHGSDHSLVFTHESEDESLVSGASLSKVLKSSRGALKLVVLNACNTAKLADLLGTVADCAIGMDGSIRDSEATSFAAAFYQSLGNGCSIEVAFELAAQRLGERGRIPKLYDPQGLAAGLFLTEAAEEQAMDESLDEVRVQRSTSPPSTHAPTQGNSLTPRIGSQDLVSQPPRTRKMFLTVAAGLLLLLVIGAGISLQLSPFSVSSSTPRPSETKPPHSPTGEVSPPSAPKQASPQLHETKETPLDIFIVARRGGKDIEIDSEHPFQIGDAYGFHLTVQEPSFAAVFQISADGMLERIYPQTSELRLRTGKQGRIPPREAGDLLIDSTTDFERLVVVTAARPLLGVSSRALVKQLKLQKGWPDDWTTSIKTVPAAPVHKRVASPLRLRGSAFIPRTQRGESRAELISAYFFEIGHND